MNALSSPSNTIRRVFIAALVCAVLIAAGSTISPNRAHAGQQFTTGEARDGSYFDELLDGLAGDPDDGDGASGEEQHTTIEEKPQGDLRWLASTSDEEETRQLIWIQILSLFLRVGRI